MTDETEHETAPEAPARAAPTRFTVRNFVEPDQLKKDMGYSLADLSTAMMQQSALFVHYGVQAAKASKQVSDVKMLLEVTESKVYRALRDQFAREGQKITEGMLSNAVATHASVIGMRKALNEAMQIESVAKTAVEGFRHRRDMLVQHGLISREEMKGEVSIKRREAIADEAEAQKSRVLAMAARASVSE